MIYFNDFLRLDIGRLHTPISVSSGFFSEVWRAYYALFIGSSSHTCWCADL